MNEDKPGHCGNCGFRLDVDDVFPNSSALGLNVDMLDVDFLRDVAMRMAPSPDAGVRLFKLADNLAKEIKDVGKLRAALRPPADLYRVTYGPAMDRVDFPYTVDGFVTAIDFAADKPASTICNPNRVDLDDPTGFTEQEKALEELMR